MNTTTVIIGANGFLGRYLCRHFARNGREVVAIATDRESIKQVGVFISKTLANAGIPGNLELQSYSRNPA